MAFFLPICICFLDNKDRKIEEDMASSKLKLVLAMYFIKSFIYKTTRIVAQKVNSWFYNRYF